MAETKEIVENIDLEKVNVAVVAKDSVNSYTIQTEQNSQQITVQLNYEAATNRTYVTNYDVAPLPVQVPTKPLYYPHVLSTTEKTSYLEIIKSSSYSEVHEAINVVSSSTTSYSLYE